MKSTLALAFTFFATLGVVAWNSTVPLDERMPPTRSYYELTLGHFARTMAVGAVADVIEGVAPLEYPDWYYPEMDEEIGRDPETGEVIRLPNYQHGYIKVRVVTPIYGCTNGQEIVLLKIDPRPPERNMAFWNPDFEYFPTNHSRIVFAAIIHAPPYEVITGKLPPAWWTPKKWKQPPDPEIIFTPVDEPTLADEPALYGMTRNWWYEGYQDNLPYTHLTNLVQAARREHNWTNYYHVVRDAVPTPSAPRIWTDSYLDIIDLLCRASQAQFEYMMNDPLFPAEYQDMLQDMKVRLERYGEDE